MLGPFSIDAYLPAFPEIARSLNATPLQVQQTLTAYLFAYGAMMLWHGSISDALGRRPVILVSLFVFAIASLGCAASYSIEYLWSFRALQGLSAGAGLVVGRAMIRDRFEGPEAQKLLSLVTMIFSVAPAIAPIIGGWLHSLFNWHAIFLFLFLMTAVLLVVSYRLLPETHPIHRRQTLQARYLASSYWGVFKDREAQLLSAVIAFNFAGLFLYVTSAPVFLIEHLHLGSSEFAWLFIPAVVGIFSGAFLSGRLAGKFSAGRTVGLGYILMFTAAAGNLLYHSLLPPQLPWSVLVIGIYTFGMSLTAPTVTLMMLELFPTKRGLVASFQGFTQTMMSAVVAGVISPLVSHHVVWLAIGQFSVLVAGFICWTLYRSVMRRKGRVNR